MTQTEYINAIATRIQDTENRLDNATLLDCLTQALNEYSRRRPRKISAEDIGNDTGSLPVPDSFESQFSNIVGLYELDADGRPVLISPTKYQLLDDEIILFAGTYASATTYRIIYTASHTVGVSASTLPSVDDLALADLAASFACLLLAALAVNSENPQLGTMTLEYKSKAEMYRSLAKDLRQRCDDALAAEERERGAHGFIFWQRPKTRLLHP